MKHKVIVYTTPGCAACRIMVHLVTKALKDYKDIELETTTLSLSTKDIGEAKSLNIKDFPTTRLIETDTNKVLLELRGSYPVEYIRQSVYDAIYPN